MKAPQPSSVSLATRPVRLEAPRAALWLLLAAGAAGFVYGAYLALSYVRGDAVDARDVVLAGLGIACAIAAFTARNRHIVVDASTITEYRGGGVRRRCAVGDLVAIRNFVPGSATLVFEPGGKITVSEAMSGAGDVLELFRTILDARGAREPLRDAWLPVNYLTFPTHCVSCRAAATTSRQMAAGSMLNLGHVHVDARVYFPVPTCDACARARKRAGLVAWILATGIGAAIVAGVAAAAYASFDENKAIGVILVTGLAVLFAGVNLAGNFLPRLVDCLSIGIAATGLRSDRSAVRLWFRDHQLAIQVRQLTQECRDRRLAAMQDHLTALAQGAPTS